ncbi:recombination protein NinB [Vreelandella rituensis]|uniref:Uncharacterized protein n=1 Tax=Vreelandella rituensis TaxID=2282306 RepID=A0A368UBR2_9GAMM|nr:recombination protein NinB [Halomonas rituensis]RCV93852.1 hypothetical protein DU506_01460 [Halomonas rituensis]
MTETRTLRFDIRNRAEAELALIQAGALVLDASGETYGWTEIVVTRALYPASRQQEAYVASITKFMSHHVYWHGLTLSHRQWEDLLVAAWRKEFPVPGLTGGLAFVGGQARDLGVQSCSQLIDLAEAILSHLNLSLDSPPSQPINVIQTGDELCDLQALSLVRDHAKPVHVGTALAAKRSVKPKRPSRQRGWDNIRTRPALPVPVVASSSENESL